jgi:predicted Zn-dependent protease
MIDICAFIDSFRQAFPSLNCFLWEYKDHHVDVRFAVKKIVQNRFQEKVSYRLVLLDEQNRCLNHDFNQLTNQEDFLDLVKKLQPELTRQKPLEYKPLIPHSKKDWSPRENSPVHLPSLFSYLGEHFHLAEQYGWDNHAGLLSHSNQHNTLVTTKGAHLSYKQHYFHWDSSAFKKDDEITEKYLLHRLEDLPAERVHQQFHRFLSLPYQDHSSILPTTRPRVLLSSKAMAHLLEYFFYADHLNSYSLRQETSAFLSYWKEKQSLFHPLMNLSDDPNFPKKILSTPIDGLGQERKTFPLIEKGSLVQFLSTQREHHHHQQKQHYASAHSDGLHDRQPSVYDLTMSGGKDLPLDELFAQLQNGYYLHDVHYLTLGDPQKLTLYGLTRGGFISVQNGKAVSKVGNMRFEVSLFELFRQMETLGKCEEHLSWQGSVVCPSLLSQGMHFTQAAASI